MNIPNAPVKAVFFMHLILTTWSALSFWMPSSYVYYNMFFLIFLIWSLVQTDNSESLSMALITDAASIILDIVILSVYFPHYGDDTAKFSAGMCILNLILRPLSIIVIYRVYQARNGMDIENIFSGVTSGGRGGGGSYENIDQHRQQPQFHHQPVPPPTGQQPPAYGSDKPAIPSQ